MKTCTFVKERFSGNILITLWNNPILKYPYWVLWNEMKTVLGLFEARKKNYSPLRYHWKFFFSPDLKDLSPFNNLSNNLWSRSLVVKALSSEVRGPEFDATSWLSVVKVADHCLFQKSTCRCFTGRQDPYW